MFQEDLFRVGLRALLDGDEELLGAVERRYDADSTAVGWDCVPGFDTSEFWSHALNWLTREVAVPIESDARIEGTA